MCNDEEKTQEVLIRSVMSLCEGAKTRVSGNPQLSEESEVKVEMHEGPALSHISCSCDRCCH